MQLPPQSPVNGEPPQDFRFPGSRGHGVHRRAGFTLVELLVVIGVMVIMTSLVTPAFHNMNAAGNIDEAAYDLKGALEVARSYATSNNTYVWVGFYEEDGSRSSTSPATAGTGRIVVSIVASKDGTMIYDPTALAANPANAVAVPPESLLQVNKLLKINNMHLKTAAPGDPAFPAANPNSGGGDFQSRPAANDGNSQIGDTTPGTPSSRPFQYPVGSSSAPAQYIFRKAIQFSPRGEARVNNSNYPVTPVIEIGLQPTHGGVVDANAKNVAAIQITGIAGNVTIYRP